ncbi:MAG: site-specific integrase [Lachnospiraceae bacterium]|nr:site-specific integrase [Lachnospiraceae bacterium]
MARKGENIYKRKDGRWEGRYIKERIGKKIKYGYVYGRRYNDVKKRLLECKTDIAANAENKNDSKFTRLSGMWLEQCKVTCKESTIIKYQNVIENHLNPYLGEYEISKITSDDITKLCKELYLHGGKNENGLASKTVTDIVSVLRRIRTYAIEEKYSVSFDISNIKQKRKHQKLRIFDKKEQDILQRHLTGNQSLSNLGILLCLYTGIRIGELCALKWSDISFERKSIFIGRTMFRLQVKEAKKTKIFITTPKSSCSIRTIPLPDAILKLLAAYQDNPDTFFLTGNAEKFVEPRTMQYRFKSVLQKCEITDANFHALRHTFATRCVEAGFDIKSLSEILGHSSVNITLNRYVHPSMEFKRNNMNKLEEFLAVK